ncbi:hypothetical protein C1645_875878 [Glomus cerebriforme]|uniref:HMG box domain-containing protein n=1 Tax=Glomus cerebriforme TaxID=658196 RepID=A0A397SXK6_9GLOM|nr:hypothetical protein C1645_875878 [Glomus cerebriforme]
MSSRTCVFIESSGDPKIKGQLINTKSFIKPKFPPKIDLLGLITKQAYSDSSKSNSGRAPNAFIIYRKAFVEAARNDGYQLPMTVVSSMASQSWETEPEIVKEEYKRLAKEANEIRNKLIPKFRKRKRKKWNIVSFPPSNDSSSSSSAINKSKSEEKLENKEQPELPNELFKIPCDITSEIVDTLSTDSTADLSTNITSTNSDVQIQNVYYDLNLNNWIPQSSADTEFYNHEFFTFNTEFPYYYDDQFSCPFITFYDEISYPNTEF